MNIRRETGGVSSCCFRPKDRLKGKHAHVKHKGENNRPIGNRGEKRPKKKGMNDRQRMFRARTVNNTASCKGSQQLKHAGHCISSASLSGAASAVFPDQPEKQEDFKEHLISNEIPVETLLLFTREDDGLLKELGLNIGQRKKLLDWIDSMNGWENHTSLMPHVIVLIFSFRPSWKIAERRRKRWLHNGLECLFSKRFLYIIDFPFMVNYSYKPMIRARTLALDTSPSIVIRIIGGNCNYVPAEVARMQ